MADRSEWKNYFHFGEVGRYFFRKKNDGIKTNFYLKIMHGINRLSILIFLAAIIILIIKHLID